MSVLYLSFTAIYIQCFVGKLWYCDFTNVPSAYVEHIGTKWDCLNYGGDWVNNKRNFDSFFEAGKSLLVLVTGEGWVDLMWASISGEQVNKVPNFDKGLKTEGLLFVVTMIIFNFVILNIFTGVVVDSFFQQKN